MTKRRNHDAAFKALVALEAVKAERRVSELAAEYGVHPTIIHQRKRSLLEGAAGFFERSGKAAVGAKVAEETVPDLHAKIRELTVAKDFCHEAQALDRQVTRGMIDQTHPTLSVGAQCRLLSISRSSFHCAPQGEAAMNCNLMLLIDKPVLDTPFYGVRQMTWHLQHEGCHKPEARPAADAPHAVNADLPEARRQNAREGAQDLSLFAGRAAGESAYPGPVRRHYFHRNAPRLPLSGGGDGLVHPQGAGLAHFQHLGSRLLPQGAERGDP